MWQSGPGGHTGADRRRHPRHEYHVTDGVQIEIRCPGRAASPCRVVPHNISGTGLGSIHGGCMPPGATCRVHLSAWDGTTSPITGRVVRCDCLRGQVYDVGVRFITRLNAAEDAADQFSSPGYNRAVVVGLCREIIQLAEYGAPHAELGAKADELVSQCHEEHPDS